MRLHYRVISLGKLTVCWHLGLNPHAMIRVRVEAEADTVVSHVAQSQEMAIFIVVTLLNHL